MKDYSFLEKNFVDINKNAVTSFLAHLQELRSRSVDKIVFVEGVDDLKLYNDIYSLKYKTYKLGFAPTYGKPNISKLFSMLEKGEFGDENLDFILSKKVTTIVDSDYDNLIHSYNNNRNFKLFNIKYLPVYSLENYFFKSDNIKQIFKVLGLTEINYSFYKKQLEKFHKFVINYEVCNFVKTESIFKETQIRLNDLPTLKNLNYYDIEFDGNDYFFREPYNSLLTKSIDEVRRTYDKQDLNFIMDYLKDISKIRGKPFRSLFYENISNKNLKALPDFKELFKISNYLNFELPDLE
jgi:hypothetical protein